MDNDSPEHPDTLKDLGSLVSNCSPVAPAHLQPFLDTLGLSLEYSPDTLPAIRYGWYRIQPTLDKAARATRRALGRLRR